MEGISVGKIISIKSEPLYENEYQRYMFYKDNAETMGRLGQLPIEAAKATAAFYESKASVFVQIVNAECKERESKWKESQ